jgi:hypothetical protein
VEKDIVDSLTDKTVTDNSIRETACISCSGNYQTNIDLKTKPYLAKTNLW